MKEKNNQITLRDYALSMNNNKTSETFGIRIDEKQIEKDMKELQTSLNKIKTDFENFKKEQNIRLIEFLGIFTAILAFITISGKVIIDNLGLLQVLLFLPMFALIMLLFILGINSLIVRENKKQFYILLITFIIIELISLIISIKYGLLK